MKCSAILGIGKDATQYLVFFSKKLLKPQFDFLENLIYVKSFLKPSKLISFRRKGDILDA